MNKQEFYRQEYQRLKPGWTDSLVMCRNLIDGFIDPETKILDIGCGHGDFFKPVYDKTSHTYGIDPDKDALAKNTAVKNKVAGSAESLPFEDNSFDLVILMWVLEHLPNPEKSFQEIYRVLKPGGKMVFLTPNAWNYNVWLIRLIPNVFHDFLTKKLYNRGQDDTYAKKYKVNSVSKIARTLEPLNFKKSQLILNGDPSYISFNNLLFKLACFIERILDHKPFNYMKVHLIGVYEKA